MGAAKIYNGSGWDYLGIAMVPSESSQVVASATEVQSTTPNDITGLTVTITVPSTAAVYEVSTSLDIILNNAGSTAVFELVVDGVAQSSQLIWAPTTAGSRIQTAKQWRVTGLSAGSHTFKIQGRLTAIFAHAVAVQGVHSQMIVERTAAPSSIVTKASYQTTAPSSPMTGDQWYDTTYGIKKLWTGAAWLAVGYGPTFKQKTLVTANSAAFSAETVLATLPAITFDGVTEVELEFTFYNFNKTVATDTCTVTLWDGATAGSGTQVGGVILPGTTLAGGGVVRTRIVPTAAAHTYTARGLRSAGTGTMTLGAGSTTPGVLSVFPIS